MTNNIVCLLLAGFCLFVLRWSLARLPQLVLNLGTQVTPSLSIVLDVIMGIHLHI